MHSQMKTAVRRALLLVAFGLGIGGTQARADGPPAAPVVDKAAAFTWSGFYVGAFTGWARLEVDRDYPVDEHYVIAGSSFKQEATGWITGGHIGFNHQFGHLVAGAELSVARADLESTGIFQGYPTDPPVLLTVKMDTLVTATARLGVARGPILIYAKGGYAGAEMATRSWDPAPHWSDVSHWTGGWTLGTGFELALHRNVTWGVEYSYVDLDVDTHNGPVNFSNTGGARPAPPRYQNVVIDPDLQIVTTRLNFKFGP